MKFIKKYDLYFVFGASILIALAMMLFNRTREIGDNLFTEMTGVAMTVFVINKILERNDQRKRIAIDQRILREVQSIIASYFTIWKHLAWQFLPEEKIENEKDFPGIYSRLVKSATLSGQFTIISIHDPESWKLFFHSRSIKDCFINYSEILSQDIQTFINDFKMFIEPELLDTMLNIMECRLFKDIFLMGQEGTEKVFLELGQDVDRLDSYISPDDLGHIELFTLLMNYSRHLKNRMVKFSEVTTELYQLKNYFLNPRQFVL